MTNHNGIYVPSDLVGSSDEFVAGRGQLVTEVNGLLELLRNAQAEGISTKLGALGTLPYIGSDFVHNDPKTQLLLADYGAALYQQNPEEGGPLTLGAAVMKDAITEITYVTGTPESLRRLREMAGSDSKYSLSSIEALFGREIKRANTLPEYTMYEIRTSGAVTKHFTGTDGINRSRPVVTVDSLEKARKTFRLIKNSIL